MIKLVVVFVFLPSSFALFRYVLVRCSHMSTTLKLSFFKGQSKSYIRSSFSKSVSVVLDIVSLEIRHYHRLNQAVFSHRYFDGFALFKTLDTYLFNEIPALLIGLLSLFEEFFEKSWLFFICLLWVRLILNLLLLSSEVKLLQRFSKPGYLLIFLLYLLILLLILINQLLNLSVVFCYLLKLLILVGKLFDIVQCMHETVGDRTF